MEVSGEVADLLVREGLQVAEIAAKLAGKGVVSAAALIVALLKGNYKTVGKVGVNRLNKENAEDRLQPGTSVSSFDVPSYIFLRPEEHPSSYTNHQLSYLNVPKSGRGQNQKTIFPTICSSETQPTVVLRESTEVERWSPMQKYRLSGTW